MDKSVKKDLLSNVVAISDVSYNAQEFRAIFRLKTGIKFNGCITYSHCSFTPIQKDRIPDIEQIAWKKNSVFGNGPGITTNITFTERCSQTDREEYQTLLEPKRVYVGGYRLYPYEFQYIPLLSTSSRIYSAWSDLQNFTRKKKLAKQNLKDVLVLAEARYDLREYH